MSPVSRQPADEEPSPSASLHLTLQPTGFKVRFAATGPRAFVLFSLAAAFIAVVVTVVLCQPKLGTDLAMALVSAELVASVIAMLLFARPHGGKREALTGPEEPQPAPDHLSSNGVPGPGSAQRPAAGELRGPKRDAKHRRGSCPAKLADGPHGDLSRHPSS